MRPPWWVFVVAALCAAALSELDTLRGFASVVPAAAPLRSLQELSAELTEVREELREAKLACRPADQTKRRDCVQAFYEVEWMGNTVVWPNAAPECQLRYRGSSELAAQFRGKRLLMVGDSLTRRFCITLRHMLQGKHLTTADLGEDAKEHSRIDFSTNDTTLVFEWAPLAVDVLDLLNTADLAAYDLVVISAGIHDSQPSLQDLQVHPGVNDVGPGQWVKTVAALLARVKTLSSAGQAIMFRREPPPSVPFNNPRYEDLSMRLLMGWPDQALAFDTKRIVKGRYEAATRIGGKANFHFGTAARVAFVQSFALLVDVLCQAGQVATSVCPDAGAR